MLTEELRLQAGEDTNDRIFELRSGDIDEEKRQICFTFSSETPVERPWGIEILSHEPGAADLERINKRGAFLLNHDVNLHIGAVMECAMDGGKGKALCQFSRSSLAQDAFQDVIDGLRPNVSFRYKIQDMKKLPSEGDGPDRYLITRYEILEISLVSIPADYSVGIGRSFSQSNNEGVLMSTPVLEDKRSTAAIDMSAAVAAERQRISEISDVARQYGQESLAKRYIDEGRSIQEFKVEILRSMPATPPENTPKQTNKIELGLSQSEARSFSLCKAIFARSSGNWDHAGFEREVIEATSKMVRNADPQAIYIPMDVLRADNGGLKATIKGSGGDFVAEELRSASFIDALRDRLVIRQLGATFISDLSSDVAFPKQTGKVTAQWVKEGEAVKKSDITTGSVHLKPRTLSSFAEFTRKLLIQSSVDVEQFVRNDIAQQIALAIDAAAISGDTKYGGPVGILNTEGIGRVKTGDGAAAWPHIVELETKIAEMNADISTMAYVCGAKLRGKLKTTEISKNTAKFIWSAADNGVEMMNGYRALCSNLVPVTTKASKQFATLIFGAWDQLLVGNFGVLGIIVDPYTAAQASSIRIIATQEADVAIRNPESFAVLEDASLSGSDATA